MFRNINVISRVKRNLKDSLRTLVNKYNEAYSNPILLLSLIASCIFLASIVVAYIFFFNRKRELLVQILAESFGIVLDIGVLGILMIWINSINDKKRKVSEAQKEIDDLRFWGYDQIGYEEIGKTIYMQSSIEIGDLIIKRWQVGYSSVKIVRNIKTLAGYGITNIDLSYVQVPSSKLSGLNLSGSNLDKGNFTGCNLTDVNLKEVTAVSANFAKSDLTGVSFRGAKVNGARFDNAIFMQVDCCFGRFLSTSFAEAKVHNVQFYKANLKAADFTNAELVAVNFLHCTGITAEQLAKAKYIVRCNLPDGITLEEIKKIKDFEKASQQQKLHKGQSKSV